MTISEPQISRYAASIQALQEVVMPKSETVQVGDQTWTVPNETQVFAHHNVIVFRVNHAAGDASPEQLALALCGKAYPPERGYFGHHAVVVQITQTE